MKTFSTKGMAALKGCFATDKEGNTHLRVVLGQPEDLKTTVNSTSHRSLETILTSAIVLDKDGNNAICLAQVDFGKTVEGAQKEKREKAAELEAAKIEAAKETEEDKK